jgi:hypothetical protein
MAGRPLNPPRIVLFKNQKNTVRIAIELLA